MKRIYFNDICVFISDKVDNGEICYVKNRDDIERISVKLKKKKITNDITLRGYKKKQIFNDFKSCFIIINAAGGLVVKDEKYLLIKRFGLWDLPKGKAEKNEKIKETATREVEEETGVGGLKIEKKLKSTYHIFKTGKGWKFKKTFWYLMSTEDNSKLSPQTDEDITEAVWMKKKDAGSAISQSYRSIADTFSKVFM